MGQTSYNNSCRQCPLGKVLFIFDERYCVWYTGIHIEQELMTDITFAYRWYPYRSSTANTIYVFGSNQLHATFVYMVN